MANPVVKIRPVIESGRVTGHVVWCSTGDCEHVEVATGKVDAQSRQRKHYYRHRTDRVRLTRRSVAS